MNSNLRTLLLIDAVFGVLAASFIFVNLEVWNRDHSILTMSTYYLFYFLARFIAFTVGTIFILRNRLNVLFRLGLVFAIAQYLIIAYLLPTISNQLLWLFLISTPSAVCVSFYTLAFNQLVALYGSDNTVATGDTTSATANPKNGYEHFFSIKTYLTTTTFIIFPILFGFLISKSSFETFSLTMTSVMLFALLLTTKLKPVHLNLGASDKRFIHDLLDSSRTSMIDPRVLTTHTVFLFLGSLYIQFKDSSGGYFSYEISSDTLTIGILNVIYFIVASIALLLYHRLPKVSPSRWFIFSIGIVFVASSLSLSPTPSTLLVAAIILSFSNYYFNTTFSALSFKLMNSLDDYGKLLIIYKREVVMIAGKTTITLATMGLAIENLHSEAYPILVFAVLAISIVVVVLYRRLDTSITSRDRGRDPA